MSPESQKAILIPLLAFLVLNITLVPKMAGINKFCRVKDALSKPIPFQLVLTAIVFPILLLLQASPLLLYELGGLHLLYLEFVLHVSTWKRRMRLCLQWTDL